MTERGDELDHSLLGRKSEGRGEKIGKEQEGDVAWLYFPNKAPNKCVYVCVGLFVSLRERDGDMEGGCYSPIFHTWLPREGCE